MKILVVASEKGVLRAYFSSDYVLFVSVYPHYHETLPSIQPLFTQGDEHELSTYFDGNVYR
jgi:hypothetical protein